MDKNVIIEVIETLQQIIQELLADDCLSPSGLAQINVRLDKMKAKQQAIDESGNTGIEHDSSKI